MKAWLRRKGLATSLMIRRSVAKLHPPEPPCQKWPNIAGRQSPNRFPNGGPAP